jgi:hypothetical protein
MYNGIAEVCDIEIGKEYIIGTYLNGQWYQESYTITESTIIEWDIDLPSEACEQIF